jgi:hypothetical protein
MRKQFIYICDNFNLYFNSAKTAKRNECKLLTISILEPRSIIHNYADSYLIGFLFTSFTDFYLRGFPKQSDREQFGNPTGSDQRWRNIGCLSSNVTGQFLPTWNVSFGKDNLVVALT